MKFSVSQYFPFLMYTLRGNERIIFVVMLAILYSDAEEADRQNSRLVEPNKLRERFQLNEIRFIR